LVEEVFVAKVIGEGKVTIPLCVEEGEVEDGYCVKV